jgi:Domain of unknown function (DUF4192)
VNSLPPPRDPAAIRVSTAGQLLAVVPALLGGTEPDQSMVVVAAAPPHGKVIGVICCPLPDPPGPAAVRQLAAGICDTLAQDGAAIILAVGYGPGPLVTPVADALPPAPGCYPDLARGSGCALITSLSPVPGLPLSGELFALAGLTAVEFALMVILWTFGTVPDLGS